LHRLRDLARAGKSASTQAGEFVREEIHHMREGKHGARSAKQAIAIGLSKARRAGVKLPPRGGKETSRAKREPDPDRSRAISAVLRGESRRVASHRALARQTHRSAEQRSPASGRASAMKAARTKGMAGRRRAAKKAAHTRSRRAAAR